MNRLPLVYKYYTFIEGCFNNLSDDERERILDEIERNIHNETTNSIYHVLLNIILSNGGNVKNIRLEPIEVSFESLRRGDLFITINARVYSTDTITIREPKRSSRELHRALVYGINGWAVIEFREENVTFFNELITGQDYQFINLRASKTTQNTNYNLLFHTESRLESSTFTLEERNQLNSIDFRELVNFDNIGTINSVHSNDLNFKELRVISREAREFTKNNRTIGFTQYTLSDGTNSINLTDWSNNLNWSYNNCFDLYFISSRFYEPRGNYSLSLGPYSYIRLLPRDETFGNIFELNNLFSSTYQESANFIELNVRLISILKIETIETKRQTPFDLWRFQLILDDGTAAIKAFISLRNLLPLLPSYDESFYSDASSKSLREAFEPHLILRYIHIVGRVNRYQVPSIRNEDKIYTSIFIEQPVDIVIVPLEQALEAL